GCSGELCTVSNMSPAGALLLVANAGGLPEQFDLHVDGYSQRCTARWRRPDRIGVKFKPEPAAPRVSHLGIHPEWLVVVSNLTKGNPGRRSDHASATFSPTDIGSDAFNRRSPGAAVPAPRGVHGGPSGLIRRKHLRLQRFGRRCRESTVGSAL